MEAESKLGETPAGYVQQSPWLSISNKQVEFMTRLMPELGFTPASRSRLVARPPSEKSQHERDLEARFFD